MGNSGEKAGFIVPPPGLIPARGAEEAAPPAPITPVSFPGFVPVPIGVTVPSAPQPADAGQEAHAAAAPAALERPRNVLPQEDTLIPKIWRLTFADGQSLEATSSMVIGRDPAVVPVRPQAQRIPVADPAKSVSKTHAIIDLEATELSVTDLHSTNGVIVTRPDGRQDDLPPGGRTVLFVGSRVLLGEFAIDITRE
ncbi:FHA domain-containing protein [Glaciibacter sp. 2TAF33]|uniref:FHA domain-containing protein n=1 Tax=Glaciibacter sp. 2TAF33 TaxID=3233015 RepID=UPI003F93A751